MSEKLLCPTCGLHFDDEFEDTLKPECGLWRAYNASKLTDEDKKKVWDWWFSAPGNYIAHKYELLLAVSLSAFQKMEATEGHGNQFAVAVGEKKWKKMSEKQQREFQRRYHKWVQNLMCQPGGVWAYLGEEFARVDRVTQFVNSFLPKKAKRDSSVIIPKKVKKSNLPFSKMQIKKAPKK